MSLEIVNRTVNSEADKRLSIVAHTVGRTISVGSDWTRLRIGVRLSLNHTATNITSPPFFYFGLTAGTTAMPGAATPNHFLGIRNNPANTTWTSQPEGMFTMGQNIFQRVQIQAGTVTASTPTGLTANIQTWRSVNGRSAIILEFLKGSPDWTLNGRCNQFLDANITQSDITSVMTLDPLTSTGVWRDQVYSAALKTVTVNEATYGDLDTICFSWNDLSIPFELSDVFWARMA